MSLGQMRQTVFSDSNMTLFQGAINDQFSKLSQIPILQGVQIDGIQIVAGTAKVVNHGLQRIPRGLFLASNLANAVVWNDAFSDSATLTLNASANTTVSIWVY